jgi:hypothetical protein
VHALQPSLKAVLQTVLLHSTKRLFRIAQNLELIMQATIVVLFFAFLHPFNYGK